MICGMGEQGAAGRGWGRRGWGLVARRYAGGRGTRSQHEGDTESRARRHAPVLLRQGRCRRPRKHGGGRGGWAADVQAQGQRVAPRCRLHGRAAPRKE